MLRLTPRARNRRRSQAPQKLRAEQGAQRPESSFRRVNTPRRNRLEPKRASPWLRGVGLATTAVMVGAGGLAGCASVSHASTEGAPIETVAAETIALGGATESKAETSRRTFDEALAHSSEVRKSVLAQGHVPGELLVRSNVPVVKNIGATLRSLGRAVTAPFTLIEGAVRTDGDIAKQGVDDFARGLLGVVGLEHIVMGDYHAANGGITGSASLPDAYAEKIIDAKSEWRKYSEEERDRDYSHGMKKWHTLSNAKLTDEAGVLELPWLFLGGIAHELDPGGASAEIEGQGFVSWLWDSPLDVAANTMGMLGGLLLPESAHAEYARVVGNLIPGPYDPFEEGGDHDKGIFGSAKETTETADSHVSE